MASTYTLNLGLRKPEHRDPETVESWDGVINTNLDIIDVAVGNRTYSEHNYIHNSEALSTSLNNLDIALQDVSDSIPAITAPQFAALVGPTGYPPTGANPYATINYVRVNRKEQFFPEYAGATFTPAPGGANAGVMTTNAEMIANYMYNYYKWVATLGTLQSYDISLQLRIPETFLNWLTKALSVDICTELTDPLECKVRVYIYKDGVALGPLDSTDKVSTPNPATWYDERHISDVITFSDTQLGTTLNLGAGDVIDILIRVYSRNSRYVKVGAVTLGYRG